MSSRSSNSNTKKPVADMPFERKTRKCLMCGSEFTSEHVGNRVCQSCKGTAAWREGDQAA